MSGDMNTYLYLGAAILFLAFLVWRMHREATNPRWREISQGTRDERTRNEREG